MLAAMVSENRKLSSNAAPIWPRSDAQRHVAHVVPVDQDLAAVGVEQPLTPG